MTATQLADRLAKTGVWEFLPTPVAEMNTYRNRLSGMTVIVTYADQLDGHEWQHVSATYGQRMPSYADLVAIKRLFIGPEAKAIEVYPPEAEHVNLHEHVRHLFSCMDGDPLPDFTRGTGSL